MVRMGCGSRTTTTDASDYDADHAPVSPARPQAAAAHASSPDHHFPFAHTRLSSIARLSLFILQPLCRSSCSILTWPLFSVSTSLLIVAFHPYHGPSGLSASCALFWNTTQTGWCISTRVSLSRGRLAEHLSRVTFSAIPFHPIRVRLFESVSQARRPSSGDRIWSDPCISSFTFLFALHAARRQDRFPGHSARDPAR
jgi:hypothetical protein